MSVEYIDVETSPGITRLRPGAENLYLLFIPTDTSPDAARAIRQRLDTTLAKMANPPQVIVASDDLRIEDITDRIGRESAVDHT